MADNGKINHGKGMFGAAALTFPFQNIEIGKKEIGMDKRRAIQIMVKSSELYHLNLEDQKILFLYGVPSEVRKQLNTEGNRLVAIKSYEVAFHRYNFMHLTGIKANNTGVDSAIHFYEKCLANRLTENDFDFAKDGSTAQKLNVLENMMGIKRNP